MNQEDRRVLRTSGLAVGAIISAAVLGPATYVPAGGFVYTVLKDHYRDAMKRANGNNADRRKP